MKRLRIISLLLLLLILTSCQTNEQTAAETYLTSHSEQEIVDYFYKADLFGTGFDNPQNISSDDLFYFAGLYGQFDTEENYNTQDKQYHIPIASVYDILNQYFIDYNLEMEKCWFAEYDKEKKELIAPALSFDSQLAEYEFISGEAIDENSIKVHLLSSFDYDENTTINSDIYITAQIVNNQAKFTSCISKSR